MKTTITIARPDRRVTITQHGRSVTLRPVTRKAVFSRAGAQGPPGAVGGAYETFVADAAVGGHRVVVLTATGVVHADASNVAHAGRVHGITRGAASAGGNVELVTRGVMTEGSWNWTANAPVFFTGLGVLTQNPPSSHFSIVVAYALSATAIRVSIGENYRF